MSHSVSTPQRAERPSAASATRHRWSCVQRSAGSQPPQPVADHRRCRHLETPPTSVRVVAGAHTRPAGHGPGASTARVAQAVGHHQRSVRQHGEVAVSPAPRQRDVVPRGAAVGGAQHRVGRRRVHQQLSRWRRGHKLGLATGLHRTAGSRTSSSVRHPSREPSSVCIAPVHGAIAGLVGAEGDAGSGERAAERRLAPRPARRRSTLGARRGSSSNSG